MLESLTKDILLVLSFYVAMYGIGKILIARDRKKENNHD